MKFSFFILALFCSIHTIPSFGWGMIGHKVVGEVATKYLRKDALFAKELKLILGNEDLSDLANWPDFIKSDPSWIQASPWHYVSIPDNQTYVTATHAPSGDVVEAINRVYNDFKNKKIPREKRKEALAFLVHFVGDIQQPLHVGREEDRGGNNIQVTWLGKKSNLHSVWDEQLIEMEKLSYTEYATFLIRKHGDSKSRYEQKDVLVWTQESQDLRPLVYNYTDILEKSSFAYDYRFRVRDAMNLQLYKGGVRLAYLINQAL
jgi:hypothetical protein